MDRDNNQTGNNLDPLRTFMFFLCDKQSNDLQVIVNSSLELFRYCIPARKAILSFYKEFFHEYSTHSWIVKKRSLQGGSGQTGSNACPQSITTHQDLAQNNFNATRENQNKGKIEYVGELTRRFYEMSKLRLADEREDQISECSASNQVSVIRTAVSPSKSNLTGPASPTASNQSESSPTIECTKTIPTGPRIIPTHRKSSCNSSDMDQTPMSPSAQDTLGIGDSGPYESDGLAVDIFSEVDELIPLIKSTFDRLIEKHSMKSESAEDNHSASTSKKSHQLRQMIMDWASDLLIELNQKHYETARSISNPTSKNSQTDLLAKLVELWLDNPVHNLLVELLIQSKGDFVNLFNKICSSQNCDWLLAYTLLEMSRRPNYEGAFSSCLEFVIGCQSNYVSLTHILAYLSDNNPKALTNFPKGNIPFLISLCQTSTSLLNVLALEIPETISPEFLNKLAKETSVRYKASYKIPATYIEGLTHCIIAAPNAYKLLLLTIDVQLDNRVDLIVNDAAKVIIDSIITKIYERILIGSSKQNSRSRNNYPSYSIDALLNQIKANLAKLIEKTLSPKPVSKSAREILYSLGVLFGHSFASAVLCEYLNLPEKSYWTAIQPLLKRYLRYYEDNGTTLLSNTLALDHSSRKEIFWDNIYDLVTKMPDVNFDLDLLSKAFAEKLSATTFDIRSTAKLMKLCCLSLERVDHHRISIGTKNRLCLALPTCFFLLLEVDGDNFPEILSYIRVSLTCMTLLKQSGVASHILCRALLERSVFYGHLFNQDFNSDLISDGPEKEQMLHDDDIRLTRENLKVTLGHRFRRLPNHILRKSDSRKLSKRTCDPNKPEKQSINSYLLIEAFKSSINDIEAFANLFVEFHCPVMFDKHNWPTEDLLRVINEKNLAILRRFEQVPLFWDLYELIGQAKCLKNCLVLVKALLAAHLALWASATTKSSPDKMVSTSRLIPPLAQSGLVPSAFGLIVEVFPNLSTSEVFSVLTDIWQYIKDTSSKSQVDCGELTPEDKTAQAKAYLDRLRLFMCKQVPGPLFVKIFKEFYKPAPKMIPA